MRILLIALISVVFLFSGCRKLSQYEWVEYHETSCYPGWVDPDSKRKTKQFLEGYLRGNGIVPIAIRVRGNRIDTCPYCDCATGVVYRVKVDESQVGQMGFYGFY